VRRDNIRFCATWQCCSKPNARDRSHAMPICRRCCDGEEGAESFLSACGGDGCTKRGCDHCLSESPEWARCLTCNTPFCADCAQRCFADAAQCIACAG
jgi:hypothetical protein